MSQWFSAGFQFCLGLGAAFFVVVMVSALLSSNPRDDSDPPGGRSGVKAITDHRSGLQYLRGPGGGITPRLDVSGQQMREGEE